MLVWHHCHHVLASSQTRQSRPLLFFPRGCIFSMVKTSVCCLRHLVRVTFTLAVGKVAKIGRWWPPGLSRCCASHFGSLRRVDPLLVFLCFFVVLPTRCLLDVSRLSGLTLRPGADVCCCHRDSLIRGRLGKPCVVLLLLVWFCT